MKLFAIWLILVTALVLGLAAEWASITLPPI